MRVHHKIRQLLRAATCTKMRSFYQYHDLCRLEIHFVTLGIALLRFVAGVECFPSVDSPKLDQTAALYRIQSN